MSNQQTLRYILRFKPNALIYYHLKKLVGRTSKQNDIDFNEHYNTYIPEIDKSPALKRRLYNDAIACYYRYGCSMNQYWCHRFYSLSRYGRNEYATGHISAEIDTYCNPPEITALFNDKIETYRLFSDLFNRDVFVPNGEGSVDKQAFLDFCSRFSRVIVKPLEGSSGVGVRLVDMADTWEADELFQSCCKNESIIEEALSQHQEINKLYPYSVNTIRINTLMVDHQPIIFSAFLRTGRDHMIIDNAHAGGLFAPIDIATGIITYVARNHEGDYFLQHPDTGTVFPGFQIPSWYNVIKLAKEAALRVPNGKHIGWDIAIKNDGSPALIEGNTGSGVDAQQLSLRKGLLKDYEILLNKRFRRNRL